MTLGQRLRQLRNDSGFTLRELAARVDVGFTYLSKLENHKLGDGHGPSEELLHRLANVLNADEYELLSLAGKVPRVVHERALQHPEAFLRFASLADEDLDRLEKQAGKLQKQRSH